MPDTAVDLRCLPHPYESGRLEVEEHQPHMPIEMDAAWLLPYLCEHQLNGISGINGRHLLNQWRNLPTLNACALDYLMAHPEVKASMGSRCARLTLYFPKTIYIENRRERFIRYLDFDTWKPGDTLLDGFGFTARCAALMLPGIRSEGPVIRPLQ